MTGIKKLISSTKNGKYTLTELTHDNHDYNRAKVYDCENGDIEEIYELYVKDKDNDKEYIATDPKLSDHIGKGVKLCTRNEPAVVKFYIGIPEGVYGSTPVTPPSPAPTPTPALAPSPTPSPAPALAPNPSPTPSPAPALAPNPSLTPSPALAPNPILTPSPAPGSEPASRKALTQTQINDLADNIANIYKDGNLYQYFEKCISVELKRDMRKNLHMTNSFIMKTFPFLVLNENKQTPHIINEDEDEDAYINYNMFIIIGMNYIDGLKEIYKKSLANYGDYTGFDDEYKKKIYDKWCKAYIAAINTTFKQEEEDARIREAKKKGKSGGSRNISSRYNYMFNKTQYKLL